MQGLAKLLVIADDPQIRTNLNTILEFVGEHCVAIPSTDINQIDWSQTWSGCIVGALESPNLSQVLLSQLSLSNHVPLLVTSEFTGAVEPLSNFVGELELPLNYPQLSDALRHCREFLGRKGVQVPSNLRKNTLFRS
ncbi:response regulator, partial [Vibrio mediterranei]